MSYFHNLCKVKEKFYINYENVYLCILYSFFNDTKKHMILYSIIINEFLSFLFSKVCFSLL